MPKQDVETRSMGRGNENSGRRDNQKMKPYLALQILMQDTDEDHILSAEDICDELQKLGIDAERRSIYSDIRSINKALLMIDERIDYETAEKMLEEDESQKTIVYDEKKKGFYVRQRHFDYDDIRLLAECVYSAKFLAKGQTDRLVGVVSEFVSAYQAETIQHSAFLTDRVKTNNKSVINNIAAINEAMKKTATHKPQKISFKYLKASINDVSQQVERRGGIRYIVSPYELLISDGNYYLLAFDDESQKMKTYRVDRMKDVRPEEEPRDGADAFHAVDMQNYTKRTFGMFGGKTEHVRIQMIHPLLDTAIERFGNGPDVSYSRMDDTHFWVSANVDISDQFFGWLLGFGRRVKLLEPQNVVEQFKTYMDKIREIY